MKYFFSKKKREKSYLIEKKIYTYCFSLKKKQVCIFLKERVISSPRSLVKKKYIDAGTPLNFYFHAYGKITIRERIDSVYKDAHKSLICRHDIQSNQWKIILKTLIFFASRKICMLPIVTFILSRKRCLWKNYSRV